MSNSRELQSAQALYLQEQRMHDQTKELAAKIADELASARAELSHCRERALNEAAKVARDEMERAGSLHELAGHALGAAGELVTASRQDSASRILAAIRALKLKPEEKR